MSSKKSDVINCQFAKNRGKGGSGKIYNDFDELSTKILELEKNEKYLVSISQSNFEIDSTSSCSLYYVRESKKAVSIDVNDCIFNGDLSKDAHHIDGTSLLKESETPKLRIKSCKFSSDINSALNSKNNDHSNSFASFDISNQEIDKKDILSVKLSINNNENNKMKSMMIVSVIFAAFVVAFAFVVRTKKLRDDDKSIDDNDLVDLNEIVEKNFDALM